MSKSPSERLCEAVARCEAALSPSTRRTLVDLALCFTERKGKMALEAFGLVSVLATALGFDPPHPDQISEEASPELLERVGALGVTGEAARNLLSCLFLIGVSRGALSPGQRKIMVTVARATGFPVSRMNELAQDVLTDSARLRTQPAAGAFAVVSDVHSNVEALTAVFADLEDQGIERVICLGDVVGYGPDPLPCIDMIRKRCAVTLMGNHDYALFEGARQFNASARSAIDWSRQQMWGDRRGPGARERWRFLKELPLTHREGGNLFVHGSPRDPWREYVFLQEVQTGAGRAKLSEIFNYFDNFLFVGHTHLPCVIADDFYAAAAKDLDHRWYRPDGVRAIINVGSVGQPRDRDVRACYLIVEGNAIRWRRVPYPREKTIAKLKANAALDPSLAVRLDKGV